MGWKSAKLALCRRKTGNTWSTTMNTAISFIFHIYSMTKACSPTTHPSLYAPFTCWLRLQSRHTSAGLQKGLCAWPSNLHVYSSHTELLTDQHALIHPFMLYLIFLPVTFSPWKPSPPPSIDVANLSSLGEVSETPHALWSMLSLVSLWCFSPFVSGLHDLCLSPLLRSFMCSHSVSTRTQAPWG